MPRGTAPSMAPASLVCQVGLLVGAPKCSTAPRPPTAQHSVSVIETQTQSVCVFAQGSKWLLKDRPPEPGRQGLWGRAATRLSGLPSPPQAPRPLVPTTVAGTRWVAWFLPQGLCGGCARSPTLFQPCPPWLSAPQLLPPLSCLLGGPYSTRQPRSTEPRPPCPPGDGFTNVSPTPLSTLPTPAAASPCS